jgi:ubiquinone/menaquinone biosynthesis C-methylase UbiE
MTTKTTAETVHSRVQEQFGAVAAAYTTSAGHSDQSALRQLVALAEPNPTDQALDIATGAGHTALAFAPYVRTMVAYDLTEAMLAEVAKNAAQRGLTNVVTRQGPAEILPFSDGSFDIVSVRLASHHFADNVAAVREMARVAKPGARVVVVDNYGPEDESLDAQLQRIEKLRDPSHVRSYRLSIWRKYLNEAGLTILHERTDHYTDHPRGMNFDEWVRRSRTPPEQVAELRALFTDASAELRSLLKVDVDGDAIWFQLPQVTFIAQK